MTPPTPLPPNPTTPLPHTPLLAGPLPALVPEHHADAVRLSVLALSVALVTGLVWLFAYYLLHDLPTAPTPWPCFAALIINSLIVAVIAPRTSHHPRRLELLAHTYQLVGAILIALPPLLTHTLVRNTPSSVPWLGVWITLFPLFVPTSLRRAAASSLICASITPVLLVAWILQGLPRPDTLQTFATIFPPYVCAALALIPAAMVQRLKTSARDADARARRLGAYRLIRPLGHGGMGEVWQAEHDLLARPAAIKLIKPQSHDSTSTDDAERRASLERRFQREARATAALQCPHTISVYDYGLTPDGSFYYVMELLEGLDLESLVVRFGPLPPARTVHLLAQAAQSLAEAHAQDLTHRDIKPANLTVCRVGLTYDFLKVLDFGLVTRVTETHTTPDPRITHEGALVGTPAFMAPETIAGRPPTPQVDIYALGCVAFWLLTGRLVFPQSNTFDTLADHLHTPPPSLDPLTPQPVPPALSSLVQACLHKDPAQRPQGALDLLQRLHATAPHLSPPWTPEDARSWWNTYLSPLLHTDQPSINPYATTLS